MRVVKAKRTTRTDVMTAIAIWPPVGRGRGAVSGVNVGMAPATAGFGMAGA